jgi:hypothetical protein
MNQGALQASETTFFNDRGIMVSSTRIVVGNTTYPLRGVTSVTPTVVKPGRVGPVLAIAFGVLGLVGSHFKTGAIVLGLIFIGPGIALLLRKPTHKLHVTTTAGIVEVISTDDSQFAQALAASLNNAIIARG